jgi:hypothetical protein
MPAVALLRGLGRLLPAFAVIGPVVCVGRTGGRAVRGMGGFHRCHARSWCHRWRSDRGRRTGSRTPSRSSGFHATARPRGVIHILVRLGRPNGADRDSSTTGDAEAPGRPVGSPESVCPRARPRAHAGRRPRVDRWGERGASSAAGDDVAAATGRPVRVPSRERSGGSPRQDWGTPRRVGRNRAGVGECRQRERIDRSETNVRRCGSSRAEAYAPPISGFSATGGLSP